jgi:hypothetical protein
MSDLHLIVLLKRLQEREDIKNVSGITPGISDYGLTRECDLIRRDTFAACMARYKFTLWFICGMFPGEQIHHSLQNAIAAKTAEHYLPHLHEAPSPPTDQRAAGTE